jgi:hypothetical protein
MSQKEKTANLELILECEIRDKNGKLISIHRQPSKSLLKNFARMLRTAFNIVAPTGSASSTVTLTDTGGTSRTFYGAFMGGTTTMNNQGLAPLCALAAQYDDTYGIQVGAASTSVDRDQYQLSGKIPNGTSAGQLTYGSMTVEDTDGTPPDTIFRLIRPFTNNTTGDVTVWEIGLAIANVWASNSVPTKYNFLIARDVLSSPQTVPAGATLTVRYIFKVTA